LIADAVNQKVAFAVVKGEGFAEASACPAVVKDSHDIE
jgi:hypothetical protein